MALWSDLALYPTVTIGMLVSFLYFVLFYGRFNVCVISLNACRRMSGNLREWWNIPSLFCMRAFLISSWFVS